MTAQDKGGRVYAASGVSRWLCGSRSVSHPDTTARDKDGYTPLHAASQNGYVDIARILFEHGADVIAQDPDGWTPLHWASISEDVDLAPIFVEYGADATAQDKNGWTPLRQAAQYVQVDLAHFLVEHGAEATAQDNHGSTPLHSAEFNDHLDLAPNPCQARRRFDSLGREWIYSRGIRHRSTVMYILQSSSSSMAPTREPELH
jgi:ankyrin repeat protein